MLPKLTQYVQKRVAVRAFRWWPPEDSRHVVFEGIELHGENFRIGTPNGWRTVSPGDYIVVDASDHAYPCKPEVFESAYEQITP